MTAMSFRQQQKASREEFSLTRLIFIAALLVVASTLHGCGEKCPTDGVPFTNGKAWFKCKGETCTEDKVVCNEGCGKGVKTAADAAMEFLVNTADECVVKFTKEPSVCHKCNEGGVQCKEVDGVSQVTAFGDGGKDSTGDEPASGGGTSEVPEGDKVESATDPETPVVSLSVTEPGTHAAAKQTASLVDIPVHDHGSNSVQIASADIDAKQKLEKVTVSLLDVHVHHDGSQKLHPLGKLASSKAASIVRRAAAAGQKNH